VSSLAAWITALSCGVENSGQHRNTAFWLMNTVITLTELGFEHRLEVRPLLVWGLLLMLALTL
jgi:hypothetical protein